MPRCFFQTIIWHYINYKILHRARFSPYHQPLSRLDVDVSRFSYLSRRGSFLWGLRLREPLADATPSFLCDFSFSLLSANNYTNLNLTLANWAKTKHDKSARRAAIFGEFRPSTLSWLSPAVIVSSVSVATFSHTPLSLPLRSYQSVAMFTLSLHSLAFDSMPLPLQHF